MTTNPEGKTAYDIMRDMESGPPMTDLITELKALKEKATPGPWQVQDGCSWRRIGTSGNDGDVICPTNHPSDNHPDLYSARGGDIYANLNFIVALVNYLPAILAKLEEGERSRAWLGERFMHMTSDGPFCELCHDYLPHKADCPLAFTLESTHDRS